MMPDARSSHTFPTLVVTLDPSWADDFAVDCYECGRSVRLDKGIILPASTFGDPEGDPPDSLLVIHRGSCS